MAKRTKLPILDGHTTTTKPFVLIHMDIWGPISVPSFQVYQYFLTILDYYS